MNFRICENNRTRWSKQFLEFPALKAKEISPFYEPENEDLLLNSQISFTSILLELSLKMMMMSK